MNNNSAAALLVWKNNAEKATALDVAMKLKAADLIPPKIIITEWSNSTCNTLEDRALPLPFRTVISNSEKNFFKWKLY